MRYAARRRRSVETIADLLERLTRERQELRDHDADADTLELNRLAIVRAQWELSEALIERHLPTAERPAA